MCLQCQLLLFICVCVYIYICNIYVKLWVCVVVEPLSCVQLVRPHGLWPTRLLCPWDFLGKNVGVGCHFLLWGIFLTQGSKAHLLHYRWILYH